MSTLLDSLLNMSVKNVPFVGGPIPPSLDNSGDDSEDSCKDASLLTSQSLLRVKVRRSLNNPNPAYAMKIIR